MTGPIVTGALYIDCGAGREDEDTGAVRYWRPPRARYECLLCQSTEGPVTGSTRVREFVTNVRNDHRATCTANKKGTTA